MSASNASEIGWRELIDPELLPYLDSLSRSDLSDPVRARAEAAALPRMSAGEADDSDPLLIRDVTTEASSVSLRLYIPSHAGAGAPALIWLHGGGFVRGSVEADDLLARGIAAGTGAVVASVEYRLAPENPYPAALQDAYAALEWLAMNAADLRIDCERIGVGGCSAGGAIAASLALLARDLETHSLCFQALATPVLDDRLLTPSMREFVDTPLWDRDLAQVSWRHYLPHTDQNARYAAPGRVEDLRGLPPTYISTAACDPLRDEGIAYASRLLAAGVSVELHQFAGAFHGSHLFTETRIAQRQHEYLLDALRRGLDSVGRPSPNSRRA